MAASWGRIYGRLIEIRVAEVDAKEREHYEITFRREEIRRGPRTPLFKVIGYEGYSPCKSMYPFKLESLQIGGMYLVYARAPFESLNLPPEWRAISKQYFVPADAWIYRDANAIAAQRKLGKGYFLPSASQKDAR